ncbi:retroviral-like aspartic protease family protein [Candidatus Gottesmanbacteria bacterium]|nr:retroviral-like aspartic protease family protein [Candidatus Gottesmanbacteria bacterium]
MDLVFPYQKEKSDLLGIIYRPMASVSFQSKNNKWVPVRMIVDSGADYTLLPRYVAKRLQIDLEKDCQQITTHGVGGESYVYFLPQIRVKLGKWGRNIPLGFLDGDDVPPLLGRHLFMETFDTLLSSNHIVSFSGK